MESFIIINWMSPLSFLRALEIIFDSMKFLLANGMAPDETLHSVASHLGLYCLPMSHKKDDMLIHFECVIACNRYKHDMAQ